MAWAGDRTGPEEARLLRNAMDGRDRGPKGHITRLLEILWMQHRDWAGLGMGQGLQWQDSRHLSLDFSVVMGKGYDWSGWSDFREEAWGRSGAFAIWKEPGTGGRYSLYATRDGSLAFGFFAGRYEAMQAAERWDRESPPQWRAPEFCPGARMLAHIATGYGWTHSIPENGLHPQWPASHPVPRRQIGGRL